MYPIGKYVLLAGITGKERCSKREEAFSPLMAKIAFLFIYLSKPEATIVKHILTDIL